MEHRAPSTTPVDSASIQPKSPKNRGAWIFTAYALSGLGALAVMAYYFSDFVTH